MKLHISHPAQESTIKMNPQIPREVGRIAVAIGAATALGYLLMPKFLDRPVDQQVNVKRDFGSQPSADAEGQQTDKKKSIPRF